MNNFLINCGLLFKILKLMFCNCYLNLIICLPLQTCNETEYGYYPAIRPEVHFVMGCILAAIGVAGVLGNSLVLFVFTR